jgi:GT2 family glycosyltransferase
MIRFPENTGFTGAVNEGIRASEGMDYVILLNNDTSAEPDFVKELVRAIGKNENIFSAQAKMLKMDDETLMDDAGDFYCAFGWAFARGKGRPASAYLRPREIFSSCAGAAIYSMRILKEIGLFDENHFAYLEDTDIGWRARIRGYVNVFAPRAKVLHVGSATSGSVYNLFKVLNTSRNSIYLVYKNMPAGQIILNLPFLLFGFTVKAVFFAKKGFGKEYLTGLVNGFKMCRKGREEGKKVLYDSRNLPHYFRIQCELWVNCLRRLIG